MNFGFIIYSPKKLDKEIFSVALIIVLFLFRTAVPVFKFPFIVFYLIFSSYLIIHYYKSIVICLRDLLSAYMLVIIPFIFLCISLALSDKIYLIVIKDIINAFILLSFLFYLMIIVKDELMLKRFYYYLLLIILLFAVFISFIDLMFCFDILVYNDFLINNSITSTPEYEINSIDYNFSLVPVFFGIAVSLFLLTDDTNRTKKFFLYSILLLFILNIFFSGSRRGIFLLFGSSILLVAGIGFRSYFNVSFFIKRLQTIRWFIVNLTVTLLLIILIFLFTPYQFKNNFLEFVGSKNILITKNKLAKRIVRYTRLIYNEKGTEEIYKTLWSTEFNPEDPDSGWGSRIHRSISFLDGENVSIVPSGSIGYLMDSTCNASYDKDSNLSESYSLIADLVVKRGEIYKAYVYCFVSKDFNGNTVSLGVPFSSIADSTVSGRPFDFYNLKEKGIWKKLEIDFECNEGKVPIYLSFTKNNVKNFDHLTGYVIFAHPFYERVISNNIVKFSFQEQSFFFLKTSIMMSRKDIFRKMFDMLISEDTAFNPYSASIDINTDTSKFVEERLGRWKFAIQIFHREYSWTEKFFGGGFNFLNWYGYFFMRDKTLSDWPHNPFLSILLYSGILGLLIYCFFLYKVILYYIKYRNEYPILFIFFLITSFFAFFSSGSPFDPPVFGFFSILPFFIHSVHKREKEKELALSKSEDTAS